MPAALFMEYMQSYAEHFKVLEHVKLNTRVTAVRKAEDYDDTGCWDVTYV